jgi:FkbM family methyltransferase
MCCKENCIKEFMKKIIYDFGANNGDDIPYYLLKADLVIAVEANPNLADQIRLKYFSDIAAGRLIVKSIAITDNNNSNFIIFYQHKTKHVLSSVVKPPLLDEENWEMVTVPAQNVIELIQEYGEPYYIKIDLEHYDEHILKILFANNIRPLYISCEAHTENILSLLANEGRYHKFKRVDGNQVHKTYNQIVISTKEEYQTLVSFPFHSAGPFGEDILGPWYSFSELITQQRSGLWNWGWMDLHCSK